MSIDASIAIFGSIGECKIESLDSDKKFCVSMFQNGIWEKRKSHIGTFVHCIHPMTIPYLQVKCEPSFSLALPKLPIGIYNEILRFFREIYNTIKSEVYVGIFWNLTEKKYELYVPKQKVAGASIVYDRNKDSFIDANLVHVMDVHSHANFGAGFSGTDTADEVSTKLFGVIGNVIGNVSMAWRAGCNQKFVSLSFDDIFDNTSNDIFSVGHNAISMVEELVYTNSFTVNTLPNAKAPARFSVPKETKLEDWYRLPENYKDYMGPSNYESLLLSSMQFDDYINTPLDESYMWVSSEYKDAFTDFVGELLNWVEQTNYGAHLDSSSTRAFIGSFFDLLNEMDGLDVDVMKHVLNEMTNYITVDSYHNLLEHFSYLM